MEQDSGGRRKKSHDGSSRIFSVVTLWVSALLAFVWMSFTSCFCGHGSWMTLIGTMPAFCHANYVILSRRGLGVIEYILGSAAFAVVTLLFLKNIADILWLGHDPLL
jgi:hypothetical protein